MPPEAASATSTSSIARLRAAAESLGDRLPPLLVEADRIAATVSQGIHGRRRTGMGEAFWQFRAYSTGDSAADIDWRQSARSRHLFVREQEWEAAESVWLWADPSPSMLYASSTAVVAKAERARLIAVALGSLLCRAGERVAAFGSGERPRGGRHGLETLARHVLLTTPTAEDLPPALPLPRHARVVLLSDFLQPIETLTTHLRGLSGSGARVILVQVVDPAEEDLPFDGRTLFEGVRNDGRVLIGNAGAVRERYHELFQAHKLALADLASSLGWSIVTHRTDRPAVTSLLALYRFLAPATVR